MANNYNTIIILLSAVASCGFRSISVIGYPDTQRNVLHNIICNKADVVPSASGEWQLPDFKMDRLLQLGAGGLPGMGQVHVHVVTRRTP